MDSIILTGLTEDYHTEIALATLPRDRWGALGLFPNQSEGWVWSAPITLPAHDVQIALNADHPDLMRVELSDDRLGLLPGFSGEDSGVPGAGIEARVSWPGRDPSELGGESVRLRVHLAEDQGRRPRLYAVYVNGG